MNCYWCHKQLRFSRSTLASALKRMFDPQTRRASGDFCSNECYYEWKHDGHIGGLCEMLTQRGIEYDREFIRDWLMTSLDWDLGFGFDERATILNRLINDIKEGTHPVWTTTRNLDSLLEFHGVFVDIEFVSQWLAEHFPGMRNRWIMQGQLVDIEDTYGKILADIARGECPITQRSCIVYGMLRARGVHVDLPAVREWLRKLSNEGYDWKDEGEVIVNRIIEEVQRKNRDE